jgi:hypothetical protein
MEVRPEMIIIIVLIVVGVTYFIIQSNQKGTCPSCPVQKVYIREEQDDDDSPSQQGPSGIDLNITSGTGFAPVNPLRDFDRRAIDDSLMPPRIRNPHEPAHLEPALAPIYTQGPPQPYRKLGLLKAVVSDSNDSTDASADFQWLNLMGSKINSSQFNYYVTSTDVNNNLKMELPNQKTELYDGDHVTIANLDDTVYKVLRDKNALPLFVGII